MIGAVEVSPLAIATLVGIVLNLVIPADKKDDVK
jgi:xanthine/uracil permease